MNIFNAFSLSLEFQNTEHDENCIKMHILNAQLILQSVIFTSAILITL